MVPSVKADAQAAAAKKQRITNLLGEGIINVVWSGHTERFNGLSWIRGIKKDTVQRRTGSLISWTSDHETGNDPH